MGKHSEPIISTPGGRFHVDNLPSHEQSRRTSGETPHDSSRRGSLRPTTSEANHSSSRKSINGVVMTPQWKKKMSTWFQRWDVNGNGKLERKDFEVLGNRAQEKMGPNASSRSVTRTKNLFIYLWENFVSPDEPSHLGVITHDDWLYDHFRRRVEWDRYPRVSAALLATFGLLFDAIDTAGDGVVHLSEYKMFYALMGINESLAPESFHLMDANQDGCLSREEFLDTVTKYYYDLTPTDEQLKHSLFLGPLLDPIESPFLRS